MTFWIVATILVFASALLVLMPLARPGDLSTDTVTDVEFLKEQLRELEDRAVSSKADQETVEEERLEIARRLLKADRTAGEKRGVSDKSQLAVRITSTAALLFVPAIAFAIYSQTGSPHLPDVPLAAQSNAKLNEQSVEQLIQTAERHLEKNPNDVQGWLVLERVYGAQGSHRKRELALRNLVRLEGDKPDLLADLGEVITFQNSNVVSNEAKNLFASALKAQPTAAKPQFYLALAMQQEGLHREAIEVFDTLRSANPQDEQWIAALESRIAVSRNALGDAAPRGPTKQQIEDAGQLSADERREMISSMVEGLAEKLREAPEDKAGWLRLIQSYVVLAEYEKAEAAVISAKSHFRDDDAFAGRLDAILAGRPPLNKGTNE